MVPRQQLRTIAVIQVATATFGVIQIILRCVGMFASSRRVTVRSFVLLSSNFSHFKQISEYRTVPYATNNRYPYTSQGPVARVVN